MGKLEETSSSDSSRKKRKRDKTQKIDSSEILGSFSHQNEPIAKMRISLEKKRITSVEVSARSSSSLNSAKDARSKTSRIVLKRKNDKDTIEVVEDIWKRISSQDINLYYAVVGYGPNGRPVIDHDILVNLLINYGYHIDHILPFIDDFNAVSEEDDSFPMIMLNSYTYEIYENVKSLKSSIYERLGK